MAEFDNPIMRKLTYMKLGGPGEGCLWHPSREVRQIILPDGYFEATLAPLGVGAAEVYSTGCLGSGCLPDLSALVSFGRKLPAWARMLASMPLTPSAPL